MHTSQKLKNYTVFILILFSSVFISSTAFSQANLEQFGKNRIQTRIYKWKYFETEHFKIYHYDRAGRELARYVAEQVENDIAVVESKIGGQFPDKMNIILYNSYDEYMETNIGRKNDLQLQDMPAGTVNLVGDKLVVYFTGVHKELRRQTRAGMAKVVMDKMLFGDNIGEVVKNAVLLNMPDWTINGFIAYIVDGWDEETNSNWKNLIESYPDDNFYKLAEVDPVLAGKAFWKFVSDQYGESSMKNLVYSSQLKSSLNQGVKMTLGMKVKDAYDSVVNFYKNVYALDATKQEQPDEEKALIQIQIPDDETIVKDIRVAPRGLDVAYVTWKNGEYEVVLQKTRDNQRPSTILRGGTRDYTLDPDPDFPLLTWSNTGYKLAILYRDEGKNKLRIYNALKARIENYVIPDSRFDRVLSITFMEDDDKLVFSAIKNAQSDLYEFSIRGKRMTNITDDAWDDLQPWYVSGGSRRGILFVSNRPAAKTSVPLEVNQLPTGPMNVFFYNTTTKSTTLLRMTDVKDGEITYPIQYGSDHYAYLYDKNGVRNQYVITLENDVNNMDSAHSEPITNYTSNIISHQYNAVSNQVAHVIRDGNIYKVYYRPLLYPGVNTEVKTLQPTILKQSELQHINTLIKNAGVEQVQEKEDEPVMKRGNAFQSDFDNEGLTEEKPARRDKAERKKKDNDAIAGEDIEFEDRSPNVEPDSMYMNMRSYPYKLSFRPDFYQIRLDNSVLFTRYQSADQNNQVFANPNLGGLLSVSLDDIMEDYRFTGGVRLPLNFSGFSYFFEFQNYRRKVDWKVTYFRQENTKAAGAIFIDTLAVQGPFIQREVLGKNVTDLVQGTANYPLSRQASIRGQLALRRDALTLKAQEIYSLTQTIQDDKQYWGMTRLEYVFDNTSNPVMNIFRGTRMKVFGEYTMKLDNPGGSFYNIGTDVRYYHKLYKNITWALRFAGAHSGGSKKVLYFLGGVDNWLFPKYDTSTQIRPGEEYGFQAIATNLRGYQQNSYNGNTYAVINSEFRIPLITTFVQRPVQSSLLRNLQLVPFVDVGSAWFGVFPSEQNISNQRFFPQPGQPTLPGTNVLVTVDDSRNPIGFGYGAGLRTMLFGYFLRADAAWNAEGNTKPLIHFSMGMDF